jgi:hypothetical protein
VTRSAPSKSPTSTWNCHAVITLRNCHAGNTRIRQKSSAACQSSVRSLDVIIRSQCHATVASTSLISSAPRCVVPCSLVVTRVHGNASSAVRVKGSKSSRKNTASVSNSADVTSRTAGILVLPFATAKNRVRFATSLVTSNAATRDA